MIGCLQALEAIKYITSVGKPLTGSLLTFDALEIKFRKVSLPGCDPMYFTDEADKSDMMMEIGDIKRKDRAHTALGTRYSEEMRKYLGVLDSHP